MTQSKRKTNRGDFFSSAKKTMSKESIEKAEKKSNREIKRDKRKELTTQPSEKVKTREEMRALLHQLVKDKRK